MADVHRLGPDAKLGFGSHSYRVGGENMHAEDRRLTALHALKEQRRKKWWKKKEDF